MDGERVQVIERGVLTASDEAWAVAVRRAQVIGPLAAGSRVGAEAADGAAAELGISRRQVYVLLGRWREGEGVASDLLPRRSSGGRGGRRLSAEVEALPMVVVPVPWLATTSLLTMPGVPLLANMTEFGQSPLLSFHDLVGLGYRMVIFPQSAFRVSMKASDQFLRALKESGTQKEWIDQMQTREELYQLLDYDPTAEKWPGLSD